MKLFEITNGFMGESYVKIFVIHSTPEMALELAKDRFKTAAITDKYPNNYWDNLQIEEICADTSKAWFDGPRDY